MYAWFFSLSPMLRLLTLLPIWAILWFIAGFAAGCCGWVLRQLDQTPREFICPICEREDDEAFFAELSNYGERRAEALQSIATMKPRIQ